jgi:hypothetical protein
MAEREQPSAATDTPQNGSSGGAGEGDVSPKHVTAHIEKDTGFPAKRRGVVRREIPPPQFDNPFNERRGKCPWRTSLMAAFLFSIGVIFLSAGLWKWFNSDDRSGAIAMITLGSLSAFGVVAVVVAVGPPHACLNDNPGCWSAFDGAMKTCCDARPAFFFFFFFF